MSASSTSCSRYLPKLATAGALALLACSTTACGLEAGDYVVYRVAAASTTVSPSCYYPDSTPPPDEAEDTNSIFQSLTLSIHIGSDGNAYLTAGGLVLPGENSSGDWTFIGEDIDIEYIGMDDDARLVTTTLTTATLDISSSDAVEGSIESVATATCEYTTATPSDTTLCPSPPVPNCIQTTTFVGVEIDDVELKTSVD